MRQSGQSVLRFLSVIAVIVASASLTMGPVGADPQDGGVVTGTVSGPTWPLADLCVDALSDSSQWNGTQTGADGTYALVLPADTYRLQFRDCRSGAPDTLISGWWSPNGLVDNTAAAPLALSDGDTLNGLDATMEVGGTFVGQLATPNGDPFDGGCVNPVSVTTDNWTGGTTTPTNGGPSGTFRSDALVAGQYRIHLSDCSGQSEPFPQGWIGADGVHLVTNQDDARVFSVSGAPVDLGTVTMAAGSRLAGTIVDDTGSPVSGICVAVDTTSWGWAAGATTAADGTYATDPVLPGTWVLSFNDCRQDPTLINTLWTADGTTTNDIAQATRIAVDGSTHDMTGYDQTMNRGGTISGVVTTDSGPAGGVCVNAVAISGSSGSWLAGTQTASDGTFRVGPVLGDHIAVQIDRCSSPDPILGGVYAGPGQPLTNTAAAAVTMAVHPDTPIDGLVLHADLGATLAGVVTSEGAPLADACVSVLDPATGFPAAMRTGSDGAWSAVVPSGTYLVEAFDCIPGRGYEARFAGGAVDPALATGVVAVGGQVHGPVDIDLPAGSQTSIKGRVLTGAGLVPTACVIAVMPNQEPVAVVPTNPDGTFELGPINAGSYLVGIAGCNFSQGVPPGVTDPGDPSVVYALQWSSGAALQLDNLWADPSWVTAGSGVSTDLGTICLNPCNHPVIPTPPVPSDPTATSDGPASPDHAAPGLFDPTGFEVVVPVTADQASGPSTGAAIGAHSTPPAAIAPEPIAAADGAAKAAGAVPPPAPPVATAAGSVGESPATGGSPLWRWEIGAGALLAVTAAGLTVFRLRRTR